MLPEYIYRIIYMDFSSKTLSSKTTAITGFVFVAKKPPL